MKLSTTPAGGLFGEKHIESFLKGFGIEGVQPTQIRLSYVAGGNLPKLSLDHEVSGEIVQDSYYLHAPDVGAILINLFDLPLKNTISELEFEAAFDSIAKLRVTHNLSVLNSEVKPTGFRAIKIGE